MVRRGDRKRKAGKRGLKVSEKGHRGRIKKTGNRRPIRVAITGSIASGKSTALKEFRKRGWAVISSDEIVSQIYKDWNLTKEDLKRKLLGSTKALLAWEKKIHPEVVKRYKKWMKVQKNRMVIEIPLLFEAGLQKVFDLNLFVFCPANERKRRALKRGMSQKLWKFLEQRQWGAEKKFTLADYILHNFSKSGLKKQIKALSKALK